MTGYLKSSSAVLTFRGFLYSFLSILAIRGRKNNTVTLNGAFVKKTKINICGTNNSIFIGEHSRLKNCTIHVNGHNGSIKIEKECNLLNLELWIEDDGCTIKIGSHTTAEGGHFASTEGSSIEIGKDCMLSYGVEIRNGDSHSIFDKTTEQRINNAQPVYIGDHAWIGADAKILKGASIGSGSIIATGAIVTSATENNTLSAGVPARKIKENVFWKRER